MKILPYKIGSQSAKALKNSLRVKLKRLNTPIRKFRETLVNWGCGNPSFNTAGINIINRPEAVRRASNKLTAFQTMQAAGVNLPGFTTSREEALGWIADGRTVMARTLLNAHSGRGIVVSKTAEQLPRAPLYTRYFAKTKEMRVHIFQGKVIDYVEKKARLDRDEATYNRYVRNTTNGWIFARDGVVRNDKVIAEAQKAITALGLDFGAVDVLWNDKKAVVLEVNTAPGLCGTTLVRYTEAIRQANFR